MIKVIAIIVAAVLVVMIGFTVVVTLVNMLEGHGIAAGFQESWNSITHLFGLIKDAGAEANCIYPMTNQHITW